jgi:hypothetical protein
MRTCKGKKREPFKFLGEAGNKNDETVSGTFHGHDAHQYLYPTGSVANAFLTELRLAEIASSLCPIFSRQCRIRSSENKQYQCP